MKLTIVNIGKTQDNYLKQGIAEYEKRLKRFIPLEQFFIQDIKKSKNLSVKQIKSTEGEKILAVIDKFDYLVLLDEQGVQMTSTELADFFQSKINDRIKHLGIIIGGSFGISEEVKKKANTVLSFSKLTFSHQMIRLFLVEQIYRAFTILNNIPYHNE